MDWQASGWASRLALQKILAGSQRGWGLGVSGPAIEIGIEALSDELEPTPCERIAELPAS